MMDLSPETLLRSLWFGSGVEQPILCCECGLIIQTEETLARTFTVRQPDDMGRIRTATASIVVPALSQVICIYSRHLECLFTAARYVAISHVWHPDVVELTTANVLEDMQIVLETPTRIAHGLVGHVPVDTEIWHDYISVPQRQPRLKENIIQALPEIFGRAEFTVAYLSDIGHEIVNSMRRGVWLSDRVRGVSAMCNAKWFSRVWTAAELVVSRKLRAMLRDFTLLEDLNPGSDFIEEIFLAWSAEVRRLEDTRYLERIAGIGDNLVPWQLGPLELVHDLIRQGQRAPFGVVHELLARRCVTVPRDYLRAFLTVSISGLSEPELHADIQEALLQIANSCIEKGDYSPLFMIPESARNRETPLSNSRINGYMDFHSFGVGHVVKPAPTGNIEIRDGVPVLRMENLGRTKVVKGFEWGRPAEDVFSQVVEFVLGLTGPDVDAFVNTLAVRLYAQSREGILEHLSTGSRITELSEALEALRHETSPEIRKRIVDAIAGLLCLTNATIRNPMMRGISPMGFMGTHGRRIHLGNSAAVVAVECPRCCQWFLLRVGMVKPPSEVMSATAYRVPGLQYRFSHEGGMGILVKDGYMVARFVWGTPTCECPKLEGVPVRLDLPLPQPNEFNYGTRP